MYKIVIAISLFVAYILYSAIVYSKGTEISASVVSPQQESIVRGKQLYQQHNCTSCHQLYGLGGYLGPELTTAYSDPQRGELYMKAFLQNGGRRMPNFHFTKPEVEAIVNYLKYVDETAISYKTGYE